MEILTFNEFPTLRVIESKWYDESDKQLSFTYRDENLEVDDGLRAFIAMKRENAPIPLEGIGCKIMGYYIRKKIVLDSFMTICQYCVINYLKKA